jgi:predicted metal-binding membrane protein
MGVAGSPPNSTIDPIDAVKEQVPEPGLRAPAVLVRGERLVIGACLLGLTLLSCLYLVLLADAMDAMNGDGRASAYMWLMPMGRWGPAELVLCCVMWIVMMVAMMVPSAAPVLFAFHALSRSRPGADPVGARFVAFFLGYLLVWFAFSVLATGAQWWLHEAALVTDTMVSSSRTLDALLLVSAGIYQFVPMKSVCLSKCRAPMGFLLTEWRDGTTGALVMGLRHGAFCVGCCWGLMVLLFVGGTMNLLWIGVLAAAVLIEKALPFGGAAAKAFGLAMIAAGLWLAVMA